MRSSEVFHSSLRATLLQDLKTGADALGITLDKDKIAQLIDFLALFHKWNQAYNLSAVRDPEEMLTRHLLDSLTVYPYIHGTHIIDVGTGGGLPGVPLAICYPDKHFTLLDANGKKTRFLFQVKQALALANVQIQHQRVENWQAAQSFDAVICRAYSALPNIVQTCAHLLHSEGKILAMKAFIPGDELREVEKHYIVEAIHQLVVPALSGERKLVVLAAKSNK